MVIKKNAFVGERKELLDKHRKEWNDKMDERKNKEIAFMESYFKRVEKNENELNELISNSKCVEFHLSI